MSDFNITFEDVKTLVTSDNVEYIKEKLKVKNKEPSQVSFFQILSCLDLIDVFRILARNPTYKIAADIIGYEIVTQHMNSKTGFITESNFDCYLPFDERRDYKIKHLLKSIDNQDTK